MSNNTSHGLYKVNALATPNSGVASPQCAKARVSRTLRHALTRAREERGSALVEMALVLPVLLMLVTGIAAFGIAFGNDLSLADAVNIAGRQLAVSRGSTPDPCAMAATSVKNAVLSGMSPQNLTFTLVVNGLPNVFTTGNANCSSAAAAMQQGQDIQLIVSYPCELTIYGYNYAPSCKLTAQVTELVQ